MFLVLVSVLGHPSGGGGGGVTSSVLRGGGMDVFWNDPLDRVKNKVGHIAAFKSNRPDLYNLMHNDITRLDAREKCWS